MTDLNKGEIGQPLRVNLVEDISLATTAIILAQAGICTEKELIPTIQAVPSSVGALLSNANV